MAQIDQSGVKTFIQVNMSMTNKGLNSAEYVLFNVALHVRFGVDHIKIYMHTIPEDVFILCVNIEYLQAIVSKLFFHTTMEGMILWMESW